MQLQGESLPNPQQVHSLRPAYAFNSAAIPHNSVHIPPPPLPRVGPISAGVRIFQSEGVAALFSGVSATVLRQTLYSTTRMGLYDILKQKWTNPDSGNMPLLSKITAGLIAGGIGAAVGNPADVAMVRMQADGAMIVTASQLASYDQIKEMILENGTMKDGLGTHVTASFAAGFVAAAASNPVDVIKTRVMNMKVEPGKVAPYSGAIDCAMKTVKAEGIMALYKGFIPTISRQGPFTVVLFVTLEQVRELLKDF
ncbi:mitochondrial uncoupling protein 5-like [Populus alba x Populus x berolinensis]|uniref:Mitochondrial uncoupling protein 5-like n=1 Tax=Populus alba x Populus x berolinensis TaxID=444605 RepID=A0AAD6QW47_9ROSI|nr:mitochondrial uncoupling protein 5-like [Populus alba x Populus x berolinensis]